MNQIITMTKLTSEIQKIISYHKNNKNKKKVLMID